MFSFRSYTPRTVARSLLYQLMIAELPDCNHKHLIVQLEIKLLAYGTSSMHYPAPSLSQVEFILNPPVQEELLVSPSELLTQTVEVAWHPVRQHHNAGEWERKQNQRLMRGSFYVHSEGVTLTMTTKETKSI